MAALNKHYTHQAPFSRPSLLSTKLNGTTLFINTHMLAHMYYGYVHLRVEKLFEKKNGDGRLEISVKKMLP